MKTAVIVAIIGAATSIIVASLTFWFTKRAERQDALQQRKIEHYRELLSAISDLAVDGVDKMQANQRFSHASNTIALVAHPRVISALMAFHDEVKFSNPKPSAEEQTRKLKELILAIRESLNLPFEDDPATLNFHLIGSQPKNRNA